MSETVCDLRVTQLNSFGDTGLVCNDNDNPVKVWSALGPAPTVEEISRAASKHRLETHPCKHPECPYWVGACPYDHEQEPPGGWDPLYE